MFTIKSWSVTKCVAERNLTFQSKEPDLVHTSVGSDLCNDHCISFSAPFTGILNKLRRCFFMEKNKPYPWSGCGTDKEITGCRFSLSVMSDDYVPKILNALGDVDTSHVWQETDLLSTTYRGHKTNVINTLKELFIAINDHETHITLEATLSKGCPGDTDADIPMELVQAISASSSKNFNVHGKIAFYPMGELAYMDHIAHVVHLAINKNVYDRSSHYATQLYGDVHDLFDYFHEMFDYADEHTGHFIYQITLSINSPSAQVGLK